MKSPKRGDLQSKTGAVSNNSFLAWAWIKEARAAIIDKEYEVAIEYFKKYLNVDPSNIDVLLELGNAFYNIGQYDDAIKSYENVIDLSEKMNKSGRNYRTPMAEALKRKGNALVAKGDYEEALNLYDQVIREGNNPKISTDALYNKALVKYELENYEEADNLFNAVTNNNLNDELAWRGKAEALEKLGKKKEAFDALIKSMKSAGLKLKKQHSMR